VPRFLLPQLRQVIAVYLVYMQLFCEYLMLQMLEGDYTNYVWSNKSGL
jgi:hypothetical protein